MVFCAPVAAHAAAAAGVIAAVCCRCCCAVTFQQSCTQPHNPPWTWCHSEDTFPGLWVFGGMFEKELRNSACCFFSCA